MTFTQFSLSQFDEINVDDIASTDGENPKDKLLAIGTGKIYYYINYSPIPIECSYPFDRCYN